MATLPVLVRFQQRVLRIGAGGGLEPATEATIKFFAAGATAVTAATVPAPPTEVEIPVYGLGTVTVGDELQNGASEMERMRVTAIDEAALKIKVLNLAASPISVPQHGRLVRASAPIDVYRDPMGEVSLGSSLSAGDDGWAFAYVAEYRYDRTVMGGGATPEVYPDGEGSWVMR